MTRGVCYIAYGHSSLREVRRAIDSLKEQHTKLRIALICEKPTIMRGVYHIPYEDHTFGARGVKVMLDELSPFDQTLYLDADTKVRSDAVLKGFKILDAGWDLVIAPSANQGHLLFAHIDPDERKYTWEQITNPFPLQLQAGVMWFSKSDRILKFFDAWRDEWNKFKQHDQAAMVRALQQHPLRIWILGQDWNSRRGEIVDHYFGRATA